MLVIADAERADRHRRRDGRRRLRGRPRPRRRSCFESAYFNPLSVRRTSKALGLKTEASMRFERGADPRLPVTGDGARLRAARSTSAPARRAARSSTRYPAPRRAARRCALRRARIAGLLGVAVPDADVAAILESLGFALRAGGRRLDGHRADAPRRRRCARSTYRRSRAPLRLRPHSGHLSGAARRRRRRSTRASRARAQLRAVMTGAGFSEAVTFGFIAEAAAAPFAADGDLVADRQPAVRELRRAAAVGAARARSTRSPTTAGASSATCGCSRSARASRAPRGERRSLACAWTGGSGGDALERRHAATSTSST